jgi:hypothetical protein
VVRGIDAVHTFCLLLNKPIASVGQDQVLFLVAVLDVEIMDARIHQLKLGTLVLVVQSTTEPAIDLVLDGTVPPRTAWRAALTLDKGQSLAI